ncbi:hypothetical protein ANN_24820 [Periplaneta americana]|uniref:Uncharacterized protein n=1 Tax=Periplaneta americana TaxID=6978 RepID=A0ABQ8RZT5_PERAM|nr:hypothetical protein ANN_24820 [Periplaneta americana]
MQRLVVGDGRKLPARDEQRSRKETNSAHKAENLHENVVLRHVLDVKTGCESSETRYCDQVTMSRSQQLFIHVCYSKLRNLSTPTKCYFEDDERESKRSENEESRLRKTKATNTASESSSFVKDAVYKRGRANTLEELRQRITNAAALVTPQMPQNTWRVVEYRRLDVCRATQGAHIELHSAFS